MRFAVYALLLIGGAALCLGAGYLFGQLSVDDVPVEDVRQETGPAPVFTEAAVSGRDLPELFDCLRENGAVAIAAHRGGPAPGFPENAIETLQQNFDAGIRVFEIDIAETADGQLFLLHDRDLDRTTTGSGPVSGSSWSDVRALALEDSEGQLTPFAPPTLSVALNWAVEQKAILELDRKPTTSFERIISAVREAGAENNVIMISYNDEQAAEIARLAPDLSMTATARGKRDIDRLVAGGVDQRRLIAWLGTNAPDAAANARVANEGVEAAFGTLGRPGKRLDDQYWSDGSGSEYADLVSDGIVLIATDTPVRVANYLDTDDLARTACGL